MLTAASDATRREYAARMNRVVDFIQTHLADPLNLETLAAVACFSPFHFHRLFRGWMGETLQQFIHRLRLERAAAQLEFNPRKTITEIALDCGFSSSSAFARAFKEGFGVPASEWRNRKIRQADRKEGQAGEGAEQASWVSPGKLARPQEIAMSTMPLDVQIRTLPPTTLAYVRHVGPIKGDLPLYQRMIGQLFTWAKPRGLLGPETQLLGLYHDKIDLTPEDKYRLDVAITVPAGTVSEGEIGIKPFAGGLYAVARLTLTTDQYEEVRHAFLIGWLPSSGYQPDDRPGLEIYHSDPKADPEGRHTVEFCLPVRPL